MLTRDDSVVVYGRDETGAYEEWLRATPEGYVLVCDPRESILHHTSCPHAEVRRGTLKAPRLVSRSREALRDSTFAAGLRSCWVCRGVWQR